MAFIKKKRKMNLLVHADSAMAIVAKHTIAIFMTEFIFKIKFYYFLFKNEQNFEKILIKKTLFFMI